MKGSLRAIVLIGVMLATALCLVGCSGGGEQNAEAKKYVIASDTAFNPFEYLDEATGEYVGIDMDIMAAIAADQGIDYEMRNVGFDAAMGNVQSGQADGMIAGMTINEERKLTFDFSEPYFNDGQIMCVSKNSQYTKIDDLRGTKVAAKTGTMGAQYAEENKANYGYEIQYYEDSTAMYQAIINGTNSACFEDYTVIGAAIKNGVEVKTVGEVVNSSPYGFAVKKGTNPELIEKFNAGLKNIQANGKYAEILKNYGITVE